MYYDRERRYKERINLLVTLDQRNWLIERSKSLKCTISELIRELLDEQMLGEKAPGIMITLGSEDRKLLEELCVMSGTDDLQRLARLSIATLHVLMKTQIWKLLKPMPELAKQVLEETKKNQK